MSTLVQVPPGSPRSPVPEAPRRVLPPSGEFWTRRIDDDPALLTQAFALRYQVYCVERTFLSVADYPDRVEIDMFDRYAWHLGTVDSTGRLVATVRLVLPSILGLPLFRRCTIFPDETELYSARHSVVEVSRLSMSRIVRDAGRGGAGASTAERRRLRDAAVYSLYRGLYQISKRAGITHWVVATEASLQRNVRQFGFPFRPIGPTIDYFGPVTPHVMSLADFDRNIVSGTRPRLDGFLDGLERRHWPAPIASSPA